MTVSAICRAKNPQTCPYHGAVIAMHLAEAANDFGSYYKARQIVEKREAEGWTEQDYVEKLDEKPATGEKFMFEDQGIETFNSHIDEASGAILSSAPDVQEGKLFNRVVALNPNSPNDEGILFHRQRPGVTPVEPYYVRVQFNQPLDEEKLEQIAGLLGYSYAAHVRGENLGWPVQDTPYSFFVHADTTKSPARSISAALEEFKANFEVYLKEGTPVRKRAHKGEPAGTRAIEPVENGDSLEAVFYYDSVIHM